MSLPPSLLTDRQTDSREQASLCLAKQQVLCRVSWPLRRRHAGLSGLINMCRQVDSAARSSWERPSLGLRRGVCLWARLIKTKGAELHLEKNVFVSFFCPSPLRRARLLVSRQQRMKDKFQHISVYMSFGPLMN